MMFVWLCVVVCALTGRFVTEQSPIDGASYEVPVNDPNVLDAARFAVAEFNKANTEELFNYEIVNITSAEIQVTLLLILVRRRIRTNVKCIWV